MPRSKQRYGTRSNANSPSEPVVTETYTPVDTLFLWWLGDPTQPRFIGNLSLVHGNRAVAFE